MRPIHKLTDRQVKSLTGCTREEFYKLLVTFIVVYDDMKWEDYEENIEDREREPGGGNPGKLESHEMKLYFILHYFKAYPNFDVMGACFDMAGPNAHGNMQRLYPVLERTLRELGVLPARNFFDLEEFKDFIQGEEDLFTDATTRRRFRPKDYDEQKDYYDGKKKQHTVKNTVICNAAKFILFLGLTVKGKIHDFALLKSEFDPSISWFENVKVWIDLGYLGFEDIYECVKVFIPHKKSRKSKKNPDPQLTPEQKQENKDISSVRVVVENAIGGIKRFRILIDTYRGKCEILVDKAMLIAAGLWNFKLKFNRT